MLYKSQKNHLVTFCKKLTKTVQIQVTYPEARWVPIEFLVFESINLEF